MTQSIETELGLMQALADAEREAKRVLAAWNKNFKGRLAEPKPEAQPMQPQMTPEAPQVPYG